MRALLSFVLNNDQSAECCFVLKQYFVLAVLVYFSCKQLLSYIAYFCCRCLCYLAMFHAHLQVVEVVLMIILVVQYLMVELHVALIKM